MKISPVLSRQISLKGQKDINSAKSPSVTDAYIPVDTKGFGKLKLYMFTKMLTNPDIRKSCVEVRKKEGKVYENLCTITAQSSMLQKQSEEILKKAQTVLDEEQDAVSRLRSAYSDNSGEPKRFFNKDTNTFVIVDDKHTTICKNPVKQPDASTFNQMYIFEGSRLKEYYTNIIQTYDKGLSADEHFVFDNEHLSVYTKGYKKSKGCVSMQEYTEFGKDGFVSKYCKGYLRSANEITDIDKLYRFKGLGIISSYSENQRIRKDNTFESEVLHFDNGHLKFYRKFNPVTQSLEKELLFHNNNLLQITQNGITIPNKGDV